MATGKRADSTVDDYIEDFPPGPRKALKRVRTLIKKIAPDAVESIAYGMPAYKLDGRPLVYFAGHAGHLGLYALPKATAAFQERLSGYKTAKGSIQFPYDEDLPIALIEDIVRYRIEENRAKASARPAAKTAAKKGKKT
jgi:uncharacterized protein YdhG (YjbR/CyaY superfamily)